MARPSVARYLSALAGCCLLIAPAAFAQAQNVSAQTAPAPALRTVDPQIELNLISLPTTQSIKRHKSYFRLTHHFARDLKLGDFSDLANDLFGLDNGAVIGFEYRFAVEENIHAGIHRSTDHKTLQLFSRWDAVRQGERLPIGVSALFSFEALDNLQDGHQPGAAIVLSRTWGQALALYASPTVVGGTHAAALIAAGLGGHTHGHGGGGIDADETAETAGSNSTYYVGLGGRLRLRPTVFVVGEFTPRLAGYAPGNPTWGAAIEKWTRGHTLQLHLTNSFATTPGQIARGGNPNALYLGFNITRKF